MIRFAIVRAAALFVALESSKLLICVLRVSDGCKMHAIRLAAAGAEEVLLAAVAFLAMLGGGAVFGRFGLGSLARRGSSIALFAVAFWAAINVPVSRLIGTPLTAGMLATAGGAIGDSILRYATVSSVASVVAVLAIAAASPRLVRATRAGVWIVATLALVVLACAAARGERDAVALDRDPVLVLARSFVSRASRGATRSASADHANEAMAEDDPTTQGFDLTGLTGAARGRHVVWIILESTGARYLSTYGASTDPMPNLERIARHGIVFEHALAVHPESIKGLYSMLCSFAPAPSTSARDYDPARLPCASIAEVLAREGMRTALFHSGRFDYLGMDHVVRDRGFGELADARDIGGKYRSSFGTDDMSTARAVLARFDRRAPGERVFATYMPISGHHPYESPGEGPRPFGEVNDEDRYRSDLYRGDLALGALVDGLVARGVWEDTLLVVHGDHGEAFFQHEGNFAHTLYPYDENLHVPLVIALPGVVARPIRARQLVSLLDIAPTIAALAGAPGDARWQGRSALDPAPRVVRAFTDQAGERLALRTGRYKVVHDREIGRTALYDLRADPDERRPIDDAARTSRYLRDLDGWTARQSGLVAGSFAARPF